MLVTKAIFPVAGLGTRFLPATKAQPKEMLAVVDKPIIQYVVEDAVRAGILSPSGLPREAVLQLGETSAQRIFDILDRALEDRTWLAAEHRTGAGRS